MSKKRALGTYGFTTTPRDNFLPRVAKEAKPTDNFIVAGIKNTFTGEEGVAVLARTTALPPKSAGLSLIETTVGKRWGKAIPRTGFRALGVAVDDGSKAVNTAKAEVQRIKNYLNRRSTRVFVESV